MLLQRLTILSTINHINHTNHINHLPHNTQPTHIMASSNIIPQFATPTTPVHYFTLRSEDYALVEKWLADNGLEYGRFFASFTNVRKYLLHLSLSLSDDATTVAAVLTKYGCSAQKRRNRETAPVHLGCRIRCPLCVSYRRRCTDQGIRHDSGDGGLHTQVQAWCNVHGGGSARWALSQYVLLFVGICGATTVADIILAANEEMEKGQKQLAVCSPILQRLRCYCSH